MKIQGFKIDRFANPEFNRGGPHTLDDISRRDILIQGENQSGKTHTFNAILYCLLGETIALQTGHGNSVELQLSEDFEIFRGESGKYVNDGDEEYGPNEADDVIRDAIGPRDLIHTHFLHSRINELPLESHLPRQRIDRVLAATSDNLGEQIANLHDQIELLDEYIERKEAKIHSFEDEEILRTRQLSDIESQLKKWSSVEELAESGRLKEISEALQKDPELESRIEDLTSRKSGLITDIREKQNEQSRAKELEEETREIIVKSLEEFICPVCEERVNRSEAQNRIEGGKCPFCDQRTDIEDTVNHLEEEKAKSEGQLKEINHELSELREERDEVDSKIHSLKEKRPEISDLNSYAIRLLRDYDHDIDQIRERVTEKRGQAEEEMEKHTQMQAEIQDELEELVEDLSDLQAEREEEESTLEKLEDENISSRISDFEDLWNENYQAIAPQIAREFRLERSGQIVLESDDERNREYDRRGDLADAEIVLLNMSFAFSLNDTANQRGSIDWETIIMDEPFTRLDRDLKTDALEFLKNHDLQVILTSSDEDVWQEFDEARVLNLERQARLTDFIDD